MKRKFWISASFGALVVAAMAPWSASQANGISFRVNTPEFGIRIGAPFHRPPVYQPAPVYYEPAPVYYAPAPVYYESAPAYYPPPVHYPRYRYAPPPVVYVAPPRYYSGYGGHGRDRHRWEHRRGHDDHHWQQRDRRNRDR